MCCTHQTSSPLRATGLPHRPMRAGIHSFLPMAEARGLLDETPMNFSATSPVWPVPCGALSIEEVVDPLTRRDHMQPLRMHGACLPYYYAWTGQDVDT